MNNLSDNELVKSIAQEVMLYGGTVYQVGGAVRDEIIGVDNKDIDIEIHGISIPQVERILMKYGQVDEVGKSFGVYKIHGYDIDIALPRKERAIGELHTDFDVSVDPYMGVAEAASRRDFTMNALMKDVITGEIIDKYQGIEDIKAGIIRHVDDNRFKEDPLRVFRAAQFAARFNFKIADETITLCKSMDVSQISSERVFEETNKALLKSKYPAVYFENLRILNKLDDFFPEIKALIGCPQNQNFHKEDVWTHTMLAINHSVNERKYVSSELGFMYLALYHDIGKPECVTTDEKGIVHNIGHEEIGAEMVTVALDRLTNRKYYHDYIQNCVKDHGVLHTISSNSPKLKSARRHIDKIKYLDDVCLFSERIDSLSKIGDLSREEINKENDIIDDYIRDYKQVISKPMICANDLIEAGMKPCKEMGDMLKEARNLHLSGLDKERALKQLKGQHKDLFKTKNLQRDCDELEL